MRFKISLKVLFILFIITLTIFVTWKIYQLKTPVTTAYFRGIPFTFRQDIRKANKIPIYPNQDAIHGMFWNSNLSNITIMFKPGTKKTNGLYQLQVFELTYKLTGMYKKSITQIFAPKTITAQEIESYDNITREEGVFKIILVAPEFSDKTEVRAGGNRIFIYGETEEDFDLAVIKTLLTAMNVTIQ